MNTHTIVICPPASPSQLLEVQSLFRQYARGLEIDLAFQDFKGELAGLPGEYGEPRGKLLLATVDGIPAGCCGLRPIDNVDYVNACEMKRLFVRPEFRRLGLGRQLAEQTMDCARVAGYNCLLLDTLSDMETARNLYQELGFEEIPPYYFNPIEGAHYLKVQL